MEKQMRGAKLELISTMMIFGTIGIFVRYIPLPSSAIACARGFLGMAFLMVLLKAKGKGLSLPAIKNNFWLLFGSGAAIGINWILLFEAYRYTTVATATLCYYMQPVFVVLASPFFFKEKITIKKGCCVLTALIGMVFVSGVFDAGISANEMTGVLLSIGAAALYAADIIMNKMLKNISGYDRTVVQLGVAAIVVLPYMMLTEKTVVWQLSGISVLLLVILGIVHTGIAYSMYFHVIEVLPTQTVGIMSYLDPVIAVLLSALFLKEAMGITDVIGAVLILGSTFVSEWNNQ